MHNIDQLRCLSVDQTAETLQLDPRTVKRLLREGQLRGVDVGTSGRPHWRVSIAAIADFANVGEVLLPEITEQPTQDK